jgi:hypothetical protein
MAKSKRLPPDPEKMNEERADWAQSAIDTFMDETGCDFEDSVCDLLANLAHLCDRKGLNFEHELNRARDHYSAETNYKGKQL